MTKLTEEPVLTMFVLMQSLLQHSYASVLGLGAILYQWGEEQESIGILFIMLEHSWKVLWHPRIGSAGLYVGHEEE